MSWLRVYAFLGVALLSSSANAATATWGDELDLAPGVTRPDGNVWRNYPPGEANGALNPLVTRATGGTWFLAAPGRNNEGSVPWNGDTNNKGPLQGMNSMTFQFRFKLGSDPTTDPGNTWEPNVEGDGVDIDFVDNNIFTLEQETTGTIKWGWTFGYERRPDESFPFTNTARGVSMQFFGKGNEDFDYTVIPWDQVPLDNNQWYVGRVVADWRGGSNPNSTISIYFGSDENSLQLLKREDFEPTQQFTASLAGSSTVYPGDYNLTVIKHGAHAAVEFDYFRAFNGVLGPSTALDAAGGPTFDAADFNQDTKVDTTDFGLWQTNFGLASGATSQQGDADADGNVDGGDFITWQAQYGRGLGSLASASAVPEPSACLLLLCTSMAALVRRGNRQR